MNWKTRKIVTDFITVIVVCVVLVAMMAGCAPLTEQHQYERQDRVNVRLDIWEVCQRAYSVHGKAMRSNHDHSRRRAGGRVHTDAEVSEDIRLNNCRWIWKQYQRRNQR